MSKINNTAEKIDRMIEFIKKAMDNFPLDEPIDRKYFGYLIEDFADLDLEEELKQYYAWTLDQLAEKRKINHHSRFRQWLKQAMIMKI
jgi:hypothetical protein